MPRLIANAHTAFNVTVSLMLMLFIGLLILLLKKVPETEESQIGSSGLLDGKFLQTPAVALYEAEDVVNSMAAKAIRRKRCSLALDISPMV